MSEPINKRVEVKCSAAHAFDTFTRRIDLWWPPSHRRDPQSSLQIEAGPGGRFFETTPDGTEVDHGRVLEWGPPKRLVYTWNPGSDVGPTTVEVSFEEYDEVTVVSVTHREGDSGLAERWPERAGLFDRSWDRVLPPFVELANR